MAVASSKRYTAPLQVMGPTGPRCGDYQGLTTRLDPPGLDGLPGQRHLARFLRHKKWMYTFAANDEIIVTCAIVDAGVTGTMFLTVADRRTGHLLADVSRPGALRPLICINDAPGEGHRSRYRMPGSDVSMRTEDGFLHLIAEVGSPIGLPALGRPAVQLDLAFEIGATPGLTVIAGLDTEPPMVSTTGKNAALPVTGDVTVRLGGYVHHFDLHHGLGGFDFTSGMLPRQTQWRWAFFTGRLPDGRRIGMNLTSEFSGLSAASRENSLWLDGKLHALDPDAHITFDEKSPEGPWHVSTSDGRVDLQFAPIGVHRESLNLGVIRSDFLQPVGEFEGSIDIGAESLELRAMPGVVENQNTLW